MTDTGTRLWHVVLIRFKEGTSEVVKQEIYDAYQKLAEKCGGVEAGIQLFVVGQNLDLRKGYELVEIVVFRDNDALQTFRAHPEHAAIVQMLSPHANWVVGDLNLATAIFAPIFSQ